MGREKTLIECVLEMKKEVEEKKMEKGKYIKGDQTFYVIIFVLSLVGLIFSSNDIFDILLFLSFIAVSFLGYAEGEK